MIKKNLNSCGRIENSKRHQQNHIFNLHHADPKFILHNGCNENSKIRIKNIFPKKSFSSPETNIFDEAIDSINSYYQRIQFCLQKYKKQQIQRLLKIKSSLSQCWGAIPTTRINNRNIAQQWKKYSKNNHLKIVQSPFIHDKRRYQNIINYVQQLIAKTRRKLLMFPTVSDEWIRVIKNVEIGDTIKKRKRGLKYLHKAQEMLDISKIDSNEVDTQDSDFFSKKAFRQLFPQGEEQANTRDQTLDV